MNKDEKAIIKKHYQKISSKGGKSTVAKYGTKHMSEIVKIRWEKARKKETELST